MTTTISQRTITMYRMHGDWDSYGFDHWAGSFGTAKAHQLISAGVLVPDIDDSQFDDSDFGWTGNSTPYEIDLEAQTYEVTR